MIHYDTYLKYCCLPGTQVVSAVFVQQTMKMANSDEELAFRQKEKEKLDVECTRENAATTITISAIITLATAGIATAEDCQLRPEGEEALPAYG